MTNKADEFNRQELGTDTQPLTKFESATISKDPTTSSESTNDNNGLMSDTTTCIPKTEAEEFAAKYKEAELSELLGEHPRDENGNVINSDNVRKPMSDFEKKMIFIKIRDMKDLPTPNEHICKIIRLLQSNEVKIHEVVNIIEHDESLVVQILKLINSGFFSMRETISNVEQAVNLLGLLQIKKLVYSASIMDIFSKEVKDEFHHAYSSSALMSTIMKQFDIPVASNLPLTMLIHDIGKIVLNRFAPKKCQLARSFAEQKMIPYNWGERHVLGIDHAEVVELLLHKWEMTDDIIKPIKNHHTKGIPDDYVLETALVQFVDYIDNNARGKVTMDLNKHIMSKANIEFSKDDIREWIAYQKRFIRENE